MMRDYMTAAAATASPVDGIARKPKVKKRTRKPKDAAAAAAAAATTEQSSKSKSKSSKSGGGGVNNRADRPWNQVRRTQKVVNSFGLSDADLKYLKKNTRYNEQEIKYA